MERSIIDVLSTDSVKFDKVVMRVLVGPLITFLRANYKGGHLIYFTTHFLCSRIHEEGFMWAPYVAAFSTCVCVSLNLLSIVLES